MDVYPTVKRSVKYLLYRLFWCITHKKQKKKKKEKFRKKIKVNFHHIISEDKRGDKICSSNVDITSPDFWPWLINKWGIQTIWNFCVECLVYLPVVPIKKHFSCLVCQVIKNVKKGRWLPSFIAGTIYQTDFNFWCLYYLNTIQN